MIDSARAHERRTLRLERFDDILPEAERLAAMPVRSLGNWSAGQIFQHLALGMHGSIDGLELPIPWYKRLVARYVLKGRILRGSMPSGVRLPRESEKVLIPVGPVSTDEGLRQLRSAVERMKSTTGRKPHPFFGPLTRDEWDLLHCRHCELHLSFLIPKA